MRSDKNILVAFILNLAFSIFELIGGAFTNSVAIISDAIHDMGDAVSIGAAYVLERLFCLYAGSDFRCNSLIFPFCVPKKEKYQKISSYDKASLFGSRARK